MIVLNTPMLSSNTHIIMNRGLVSIGKAGVIMRPTKNHSKIC